MSIHIKKVRWKVNTNRKIINNDNITIHQRVVHANILDFVYSNKKTCYKNYRKNPKNSTQNLFLFNIHFEWLGTPFYVFILLVGSKDSPKKYTKGYR